MMGSKATPAPAYLDKDDQLDALELGEHDAFVQPAAAVAAAPLAAAPLAADADAALRRGFVRKVYGILTAQLALTACCLLYTSPSPRDGLLSRMPSSA